MSDTISIQGLDKAALLAALYNASRPLGMGMMHYDPAPMTRDAAQAIIDGRGDDLTAMLGFSRGTLVFDYLKGRVMKVDLSGDTLRTWGYNRDNGASAAEAVVAALREAQAADAH